MKSSSLKEFKSSNLTEFYSKNTTKLSLIWPKVENYSDKHLSKKDKMGNFDYNLKSFINICKLDCSIYLKIGESSGYFYIIKWGNIQVYKVLKHTNRKSSIISKSEYLLFSW